MIQRYIFLYLHKKITKMRSDNAIQIVNSLGEVYGKVINYLLAYAVRVGV